MSNKLYNETDIQNIANAIRSKNGSTDTYKVSQMPAAITAIRTPLCSHNMSIKFGSFDASNTFTCYISTQITNIADLAKLLYDNNHRTSETSYSWGGVGMLRVWSTNGTTVNKNSGYVTVINSDTVTLAQPTFN